MRNSGGNPTLICTSDALAVTALRRMSLIMLMVVVRCPLSVVRCPTTDNGPLTTDRFSHAAFRYAQDFIDRRQTALHLFKSVIPQRDQAALAAEPAKLHHVRVPRHHVPQRVVHDQQLINAEPAGISRLPASVAAPAS